MFGDIRKLLTLSSYQPLTLILMKADIVSSPSYATVEEKRQ